MNNVRSWQYELENIFKNKLTDGLFIISFYCGSFKITQSKLGLKNGYLACAKFFSIPEICTKLSITGFL